MASRDIFKPKTVTRASILSTVGEEGRDKFVNPVHLDAVRSSWPKPQTEQARGIAKYFEREMTPSRRNGPL